MARAMWVLAGTTAIGFVMSAYLWTHRDPCPSSPRVATSTAPQAAPVIPAKPCVDLDASLAQARKQAQTTSPSTDSPLESRAQLTETLTALLGRQPKETDDEYRARLSSMLQLVLAAPRARAVDMRREAEAKAHVTPEQSAKLDEAFTKVYAGMLSATNKAISNGTLSPYERNVAGWMKFAGEIGGELGGANDAVAQILDPTQIRAMYDAGFDWSEYLGLQAPWENFAVVPPTPRK